MRLLFDIGHPAHVHLFKNFIYYLKSNGHDITVVSRDKDITNKLLDYYQIPYTCLSKPSKNKLGMAMELIRRDIKIIQLHLGKKFEASYGTSVSISHLTALFGVPSYCFSDDDDSVIPLHVNITYPFATKIINPIGLKHKKWKNKRIFYNSYQKLSYLHPDIFKPNINVLTKYNLNPEGYVVVRKSALMAHHDKGVKGLTTDLWEKINKVIERYKIIFSEENKKSISIEPYDMHDVLAYAKMLITDSQSMATEAALVGTPCVRYSSLVGKLSCIEELVNKYKLMFEFKIGQEGPMLKMVKKIIYDPTIAIEIKKRKEKVLTDKVNLNNWMIDFFEKAVLIKPMVKK